MEYFDVCGENGAPTGETVERARAHAQGILHRTAHVWILRNRGTRPEILLQKRSMNKDSWPGQYDTPSAGHIPAGEEPVPSALRELREELGIAAAPKDLIPIGTFRVDVKTTFHDAPFLDQEVVFVYAYERPVDETALTLQAEEVESVAWFDLDEVVRATETGDGRFCVPPGGLALVCRYCETPAG